MVEHVWYASYGSNLDADRFRCYIDGGTPTGGRVGQPGCADATPPIADRPIELPYRLYFSGHSTTWSGAPAYLEHTLDPTASTLARAYLITDDQFSDILAQECGGVAPTSPLPLARQAANGGETAVAGAYGHVLVPGYLDRVPIVTCTSPNPRRASGRPSATYLATMAKGLTESHRLSDSAIAVYLDALASPSQATIALTLDFALDEHDLTDLFDANTIETRDRPANDAIPIGKTAEVVVARFIGADQ